MRSEKKNNGNHQRLEGDGLHTGRAEISRPGLLTWKREFRWQMGEGEVGWERMHNAWGWDRILLVILALMKKGDQPQEIGDWNT